MVKKLIANFICLIQKILIKTTLVLLYIIGFGITLIVVAVFNRKILGVKKANENTFWIEAENNKTDTKKLIRGS